MSVRNRSKAGLSLCEALCMANSGMSKYTISQYYFIASGNLSISHPHLAHTYRAQQYPISEDILTTARGDVSCG